MEGSTLKDKLTSEQHFESFFLERGISKEAIETSKRDIISGFGDLRLFCDEASRKNDVLIPVKQVKHPTRQGNIGVSWYNLVDYAFNGVPKDVDVNMAADRIWKLMARNFVDEFESFEKWNNLFSSKESKMANFDFDMYDLGADDDSIYFQSGGNGGGTHRMILAKVTGVENIFAKEVTIYKVNPRKKQLYDAIKDQEYKIFQFIKNSKWFEVRDIDKNIVLSMPNSSEHPLFLSQVIHDLNVYDYNNFDYVTNYLEMIENIFLLIKEIDKNLSSNVNFYNLLPKRLLSFICEQCNYIFLEDIILKDNHTKKQELMKSIKYHLAYDRKCKSKI